MTLHQQLGIMVTSAKTPLRLFVLGATGGVGRSLLNQAIDRGHQITAFVRSREKLGEPRQGLTVRGGDPRVAAELDVALPGHDAVLSAIGPPGLGRSMIVSQCARSKVAAMQATGVRRLVIVSAAVLFADGGILLAVLRRTLLRNVAEDQTEMDRVVTASVLDWTIVRPPRLTNGPLTEHYQIEDNRMPRPRLSVSRSDVVHFLLDEVERGAHRNQMVGMAGSRA